jgi:hypothetical protein
VVGDGLPKEIVSITEKHRRINSTLTYGSVSLAEGYVYFHLDSHEKLSAVTNVIGEISIKVE